MQELVGALVPLHIVPRELARVIAEYAEHKLPSWSAEGSGPNTFLIDGNGKLANGMGLHHWVCIVSTEPICRLPRRWAVKLTKSGGHHPLAVGLASPSAAQAFQWHGLVKVDDYGLARNGDSWCSDSWTDGVPWNMYDERRRFLRWYPIVANIIELSIEGDNTLRVWPREAKDRAITIQFGHLNADPHDPLHAAAMLTSAGQSAQFIEPMD